jgi:MoxR-like ATPase
MRSTTTLDDPEPVRGQTQGAPGALVLAIVWASEAGHVGEVLELPRAARGTAFVFGRGEATPGPAGHERYVHPVRQRPGVVVEVSPVASAYVSRRALRLVPEGDTIRVQSVGRRPLLQAGAEVRELCVREGDLFELKGLFVFLGVRRPGGIPPALHGGGMPAGAFGEADAHGIVGESVAAWALRDRIGFVGPRAAHVLVTGESGAGKELVARAIHASSSRGGRRIVARNAATIPAGLVDAELFGNVASYPNPGMPERAGLIGEADGSTLFLDEIAELPAELQAHLLRVLDEGEYQRLGDARRRRSDFRLLAATNGDLRRLIPELVARIGLRVEVPPLDDRREDIPLLARHVARKIGGDDPDLGARFLAARDGLRGEPRLAAELMTALVAHGYTTHVRELGAFLWASFASSRGDTLELTAEVQARIAAAGPEAAPEAAPRAERTLEEVRAALASAGGVQARAYRALGLPSRHALRRLMKKLGMSADGDGDASTT